MMVKKTVWSAPAQQRFLTRRPAAALQSRAAFTMVELLVVLAIIVVITTISIPTIDAMTSPKHTLRKEGRRIMRLMTEARTVAMSRKVQIDLRIDPTSREISMVEARAFRSLETSDSDVQALDAGTNLFEKTVVFDEEYELDSFSADRILTGDEAEEALLFQPMEASTLGDDEPGSMLAVFFTHFGGSSGGGITLVKDGIRLDIAADILTGRPKVVKLEAAE